MSNINQKTKKKAGVRMSDRFSPGLQRPHRYPEPQDAPVQDVENWSKPESKTESLQTVVQSTSTNPDLGLFTVRIAGTRDVVAINPAEPG